MKKIVSMIVCLCLLWGVLCCPVRAEEEPLSIREQVVAQAKQSYYRSLYSAGKESFAGFCGLMTSHQLYNLKINTWCITNDGKNQFDYYKDLEVTTGGYYPTAYGATEYTLKEALNAVSRYGTKDVFNLLVGFQWTKTEAGAIYGHAVLVNAILDGMVYFVESFDCSLNTFHPEGSVIVCSIEDFVGYFESRAIFDGIIHFGTGSYSDGCETVGTDVTVVTRFASQLRSQPCPVGQNDCAAVRDLAAGEQLRAIAILTDDLGRQFYRIEADGTHSYIAAGAVCPVAVNPQDLTLENVMIPNQLEAQRDGNMGGTVVAGNGGIGSVEVLVTDAEGLPVMREWTQAHGCRWEIDLLNDQLYFDLLEPGVYTVEIYADSAAPVVAGGQIQNRYSRVRLWQQELQVRR